MKAIVIGATGATGKYLVQELLNNNAYTDVIILVRRKSFEPHHKLKEIIVDFEHLENYEDQINGDVAFTTLGTTLKDAGSKDAQWKIDYELNYKFAQICAKNKIRKFVLLSAIGANSNSTIFYNKLKGKLEDSIKSLNFEQLLIFQPAGLIRPNSKRFSENLMVKIVGTFNYFGLLKNYKLIHVQDLAKVITYESTLNYKGLKIYHINLINNILSNMS